MIEVRSPGMHKGAAVRSLVEELEATRFLFAGDDLGDLEAFEAVAELRADGLPTLLVCSGSDEENALAEHADVVVDGPRRRRRVHRQPGRRALTHQHLATRLAQEPARLGEYAAVSGCAGRGVTW